MSSHTFFKANFCMGGHAREHLCILLMHAGYS